MKKQKQRKKPAKKNINSNSPQKKKMSKRELYSTIRSWVIMIALALGAGYFIISEVNASIKEHDLSRIENNIATVVQIHDPQCPSCLALQKQAKSALSEIDSDSVDYVIANIRTKKGRDFANSYRVPHVTLLLFDNKGRLKRTLSGQRQAEEIKREIESVIK